MKNVRLLIGGAVCQSPKILEKFILSLKGLIFEGIDPTFMFIDDNQIPESKNILKNANFNYETIIKNGPPKEENIYYKDETTHYWQNSLILRVANMKNEIIEYATKNNYDYLFLVDSDLIINPNLIMHLVEQNKDIISEIFWTAWEPNTIPLPNVWMYDSYEMSHPSLDKDLRLVKTEEFISTLKVPGIYEVGGLGACTLISSISLKKGVNFSPIKNISLWGEDRWFCVRAVSLGLLLFVDTHFPAKHLYREADLENNVN